MGKCDACFTLTEFNVTPMPSEWVGIPRPGAFVFRGLKPREFASAGGHQFCHWCMANIRTFSHVNRRALFQPMDVLYSTKDRVIRASNNMHKEYNNFTTTVFMEMDEKSFGSMVVMK